MLVNLLYRKKRGELLKNRFFLGVLAIMVASLGYSVIGVIGKMVDSNVHCMIMVFAQNVITLFLLMPWFLRKGPSRLKTKYIGTHIIRASCGVLASFLLYISLRKLPLFDVVLLENTSPMFIPLLAMILLREKVPWFIWFTLCVGFTGVYLVVRPMEGVDFQWELIFPITAAFFVAATFVYIKALSHRESMTNILFYFFLLSSIFSFPFVFLNGKNAAILSNIVYLVGIGFAMAIAQIFLVVAYKLSSPAKLAPFSYFEVVFGMILGTVIFHSLPSMQAIEGLGFIMTSAVITVIFEKRTCTEEGC